MLERELLSPGFDTGYSANSSTAYIMMSGESNDPEALLYEIKKYIQKCIKNGLDERDFVREKRCMYASYVSEFDSTEDIAFAMNGYAWEKLDLFVYPSLIDSITFDDVKKMANEIFKDEYFTLSAVRPIEKGAENVD
jgi:predicted Zn-dependent peptidase